LACSEVCQYDGSKEEEPEGPDLNELLDKGRQDPKAYTFFCHFFLPHVVGKQRWRNGIKTGAAISKLATVSDEAFTLLILENSWDRWLWEVGKSKEEIKAAIEDGTIPQAKYTLGKGQKARKNMGWSEDGMKRYQQIAKEIVKKDREQDKEDITEPGRNGWSKFDKEFREISQGYYRKEAPKSSNTNKDNADGGDDQTDAWLGDL